MFTAEPRAALPPRLSPFPRYKIPSLLCVFFHSTPPCLSESFAEHFSRFERQLLRFQPHTAVLSCELFARLWQQRVQRRRAQRQLAGRWVGGATSQSSQRNALENSDSFSPPSTPRDAASKRHDESAAERAQQFEAVQNESEPPSTEEGHLLLALAPPPVSASHAPSDREQRGFASLR